MRGNNLGCVLETNTKTALFGTDAAKSAGINVKEIQWQARTKITNRNFHYLIAFGKIHYDRKAVVSGIFLGIKKEILQNASEMLWMNRNLANILRFESRQRVWLV